MRMITSLVFLIGLPVAAAVAQSDIEVNKSVNNSLPGANEPVEFTVQVSNIGDQTATDVFIRDQLPPEMVIPAGTAAFASVGDYDPVTGEWLIGSLDAGINATLVVPALVIDPNPPECIINTAALGFSDGVNDTNDVARAAVYRSAGQRCVDLNVFPDVFTVATFFATCDSEEPYEGTIDVQNAGPDVARNVLVSFTQTPVIGASIRFDDARCAQSGSDVCFVDEIGVGELIRIGVTSDVFQNYTAAEFEMAVSVSTSDVDYLPNDNSASESMFAGGFSSCVEIDFDFSDLGDVGPAGCFIATAAYGSALGPHLDHLRNFRDSYLLTNAVGRSLVAFYYQHSPPLADFIAERDWLRAIVRALLTPIVYAIEYPWFALLIVSLLIASAAAWRRRNRKIRIQCLTQT